MNSRVMESLHPPGELRFAPALSVMAACDIG
jgi:hypothetical protein